MLVDQLQQLLVVVPDFGVGHNASSVQHLQTDVVVVVVLSPDRPTDSLHQLVGKLTGGDFNKKQKSLHRQLTHLLELNMLGPLVLKDGLPEQHVEDAVVEDGQFGHDLSGRA